MPRIDPNYRPLRQVALEDLEKYGPNLEGAEAECAHAYAICRETRFNPSASRIRIYPPPDRTAEYALRFVQNPISLSGDTAVPLVPVKFHNVLVDWARVELCKIEGANPDEIAVWEAEVSKGVSQILKEQWIKGNVKRVFGRHGTVVQQRLPFKLTNYILGDPI